MTAPGSWLTMLRDWDTYVAGSTYWVGAPHDSLLVDHGYATRPDPQPTKKITRNDVA